MAWDDGLVSDSRGSAVPGRVVVVSVLANATPVEATAVGATGRKPHLWELDRLRIITAVSVVAVHVLTYTAFLDRSYSAQVIQFGFVTSLHFTREIFMFITGLALVYVYAGKPLNAGRFWRKRAIGVLLPYAAWSLVYQLLNTHWPVNPAAFLGTLAFNLLTGSASFQLYYILLTLEFYVMFPWFLSILPRLARRPWLTLAVSFAIEAVVLVGVQNGLPRLGLSPTVLNLVTLFFDRFALTYQLYFVMGGLLALNLPRVKAFVARSGKWLIVSAVVGLAILDGHYLYDTLVLHGVPSLSVAVLQPAMAPYSIGAIGFLYWLVLTTTERAKRRGAVRARSVWHALSDSAFGVYLVHPLFLTACLLWLVPLIRSWPTAVVVSLTWALTAGGAIAMTLIFLRIPGLSRLMGRERPAPEWLRAEWERARTWFTGDGARRKGMARETD